MKVGQRVKVTSERHPWFGARGVVTEVDRRIPLPIRIELKAGTGNRRKAPPGWSAAAREDQVKPIAGPLVDVPKPDIYCTAGHRLTKLHPSYVRQRNLDQCPKLVPGNSSHSHSREMRPCGRKFARGYA